MLVDPLGCGLPPNSHLAGPSTGRAGRSARRGSPGLVQGFAVGCAAPEPIRSMFASWSGGCLLRVHVRQIADHSHSWLGCLIECDFAAGHRVASASAGWSAWVGIK